MTLAEKFGWDLDAGEYLSSLEYAKSPPKFDYLIPTKKADITDRGTNLAICYYLLGKKLDAAKLARETVGAVLELFYGNWTKQLIPRGFDKPDSHYWRTHWTWMHPFSEGLCWASAVGDWASVQEIAKHPVDECLVDPSFTKEDKAAYLVLACFLRGEPHKSYQHHLDSIAQRKKEKPKLVAEVVKALQTRNAAKFQETLGAYLSYFRRREFKKKALDKLLCFDGTTLMNIGKRERLDFSVPPEVEDHLIRLKD